MLCPNCSAPLSDTAKFCSNCGTPVATAASPYSAPVDGTADASPYQAQTAQTAQTAQAAQAAQPEQSPFERGYQQGYAWASGEQPPQAEPVQQQEWQQGYSQPGNSYGQPAAPVAGAAGKNHIAAGLLGIFLGSLGIHKFYLGYSREGMIMLLVTLLGSLFTLGFAAVVMEIIGIVEGIIYLTKSDDDFYYTYEYGQKPWF